MLWGWGGSLWQVPHLSETTASSQFGQSYWLCSEVKWDTRAGSEITSGWVNLQTVPCWLAVPLVGLLWLSTAVRALYSLSWLSGASSCALTKGCSWVDCVFREQYGVPCMVVWGPVVLYNQMRPQVLLWSYMGSHAGLCDLVGCWLRCTVLLVCGWAWLSAQAGLHQLHRSDALLSGLDPYLAPGWVGYCRLCHGMGREVTIWTTFQPPPPQPTPPPFPRTKLPCCIGKATGCIQQSGRTVGWACEVVGTISWVLRLPRAKGYVQQLGRDSILVCCLWRAVGYSRLFG